MTQDKINIAELLKDCPNGMELDCTMYDNCTFEGIEDVGYIDILVKTPSGIIRLTKEGCYIRHDDYAKCIIFPKGKTTWKGFQRPYINGDIVYTIGDNIAILGNRIGEHFVGFRSYCGLFNYEFDTNVVVSPQRLATEEEKQKLFQAIKDNGYKWNAETKTLEKLINKNKFVVGTTITNGKIIRKIVSRDVDSYRLEDGNYVFFNEVHKWELVPNKFDINTLVPFESRVLIRNDESQYWIPAFWGCKRVDGYTTTFGWCKYCIPFNGNEHLLETNNDCNEYYKTWK